MTEHRTLGALLIDTLVANGVDTVFGIPGVHTLELYRGLAGKPVRHVLTRHEQGAAFAADGYARATGWPGVCLLISGPGIANAMTAIGQAYSDSVPMLVISSVPASDTLGRGGGVLHEMQDQRAMTATVTGFSATAYTAEDLLDYLRRAFLSFTTGRPRPVHIEVPIDLLARRTDRAPEIFAMPAPLPAPAEPAIVAAAEWLNAARRPLLIVGGGALGAGEAIAQIAEATDGYVATTVAAKGILPEMHPANLGATLQWPAIQALAREADVVLAAGTELAETDTYVPTLGLRGQLIRVDIDPRQLSDRYRAMLPILADAPATLAAIAARLTPRGAGWRGTLGSAASLRAVVIETLDATTRLHATVLDAIRRALPADGLVCSDMTQIAYSGNALFPTDQPRTWFHPSGFGTLGYALPAAIGAKIGAPRRAVAALAGDYGFQFTLPELGTAVEAGLNLPVIIWNNDKLGQIRDDMVASGIPEIGVSLRNPDFQALARAYGAAAVLPATPEDVTEAVAAALARDVPTLIEIRQDLMADATGPRV